MNQVTKKDLKFLIDLILKVCSIEYDEEYFDKMPSNTTVMIGKHAQFLCKQKSGRIKW